LALRLAILVLANVALGGAGDQTAGAVTIAIKAEIFCLDIVLLGVGQVCDAADVLAVIPGVCFAIVGVFGAEAVGPALVVLIVVFVGVLLRAGRRTAGVTVTVVSQGRAGQDNEGEDRGAQDSGDAHGGAFLTQRPKYLGAALLSGAQPQGYCESSCGVDYETGRSRTELPL
jgi:hypothetical protein